MKATELNRQQLNELKTRYIGQKIINGQKKLVLFRPEEVSDDMIYTSSGDYEYTDSDFFCTKKKTKK